MAMPLGAISVFSILCKDTSPHWLQGSGIDPLILWSADNRSTSWGMALFHPNQRGGCRDVVKRTQSQCISCVHVYLWFSRLTGCFFIESDVMQWFPLSCVYWSHTHCSKVCCVSLFLQRTFLWPCITFIFHFTLTETAIYRTVLCDASSSQWMTALPFRQNACFMSPVSRWLLAALSVLCHY